MLHTVWPVVLIVASNVIYQICAKSVPQRGDPFASPAVTYAVAAYAWFSAAAAPAVSWRPAGRV